MSTQRQPSHSPPSPPFQRPSLALLLCYVGASSVWPSPGHLRGLPGPGRDPRPTGRRRRLRLPLLTTGTTDIHLHIHLYIDSLYLPLCSNHTPTRHSAFLSAPSPDALPSPLAGPRTPGSATRRRWARSCAGRGWAHRHASTRPSHSTTPAHATSRGAHTNQSMDSRDSTATHLHQRWTDLSGTLYPTQLMPKTTPCLSCSGRVMPLCGGAMDHVRSLWVALTDEREHLARETMWSVHKVQTALSL